MDLELGARPGGADAPAEDGVAPSAAPAPSASRPLSWGWRQRRYAAPAPALVADGASPGAEADGDLTRVSGDSGGSAGPSVTMRALKALILLVLLIFTGVGASMAWRLGRNSELHAFHMQFNASAAQLQSNFEATLNVQIKSATMGAKYIASLPDIGIGRGVFIPGFLSFAEDLVNVTRASVVTWLPLVADADRAAFEANAVDAALVQDPSGALAAQASAYGIRARDPSSPPDAAVVSFIRAPQAPLYAAAWANAPRSIPRLNDYFLFNDYGEPLRRAAIQKVINTSAPAMTDLTGWTFADPPSSDNPSSIIFAPAWIYASPNATYGVGITTVAGVEATSPPGSPPALAGGRSLCALAFHWSLVLSNSLPRFVDSIIAVLESPSGAMHTFSVSGREVHSAGAGDRHEALAHGFSQAGRRLNMQVAGATWTVTLYPTAQLRDQYLTNKPLSYALGIAAAVLGCILLFSLYEFFDRRRVRRINARLLAYVRRMEQMKLEVEEGCAREAEAKARVLAEEASSRQKDSFVAMVSHEVRTPLNAVSGATALLAGTPLSDEQRELVALLEAGTAHVVLIIDDILMHGALASGAFSVAREPLELGRSVLDPAWRMVVSQGAQRTKLESLRLTRTVAPEVPTVLLGDATRLVQVVTNLLTNAVKFTPEGGGIHLHVDVTDDAPAATADADATAAPPSSGTRWLRVRVSDTGIGVDPAKLQRIFLPFVQADATTVRRFGGTGLGLTICRRIARAMGGDLTAHSEGLGLGTTLTFVIPLRTPPPESDAAGASALPPCELVAVAGVASSPPPSPGAALSPYTPPPLAPPQLPGLSPPQSPSRGLLNILVAEDDLLSQTVMRKVLGRLQLQHTIVGDGAAAVEAFKKDRYDLVLMDLHMPVMDGLSATRQICALVACGERPYAPVVALTASCSMEERGRCREAGMQDLLPKPIRLDTLKALLLRYAGDGVGDRASAGAVVEGMRAVQAATHTGGT